MTEIQQHDGVVVEVAGFQQGFAKRCGRREMCHGREREAPGLVVWLPSPPCLYIGPLGRGGSGQTPSRWGGCQGGALPPKASGAPPTLGFPTLGAGGRPMGGAQPTRGWFPSHFSPPG